MSTFENVSIVQAANVYFDGQVTSRTVLFADGSKKTLGIMLPGEYTFNTDAPELMEIYSGELTLQLPGSDEWQPIKGGESFDVPGNAAFHVRITAVTDYCCSFK
jgi:purine/pyrimidine-nucleoside phosphorylase